ncbi:ABC transporter ATP-binding protein [Neptunomonas sp.]|uniref:ABC transporter ATP-binding protein n=1 Tax=Neptunomonas sp. TaxID=1971898 RepID=UPI0025DE7F76|nr:ABC transporter ATP-binding protein [Neptunomonas sp.]
MSKKTVEQTVLEIIKLPSGDYAMRKAGEDEPLITVNLSQKVIEGLNGQSEELARMILVAGAKMMSELSLESVEASEPPKPVIH